MWWGNMTDSTFAIGAITVLTIVAIIYPGANDIAVQGITAVASLAAGKAWGKVSVKSDR